MRQSVGSMGGEARAHVAISDLCTDTGDDGPPRTKPIPLTWVVDLPCGQVRSAYGDYALTDAMTKPWADDGVRGTLPYFIGALG